MISLGESVSEFRSVLLSSWYGLRNRGRCQGGELVRR